MTFRKLTLLLILSLFLAGCGKDEPISDVKPCENITIGVLTLETKLKFGSEDFELNKNYQVDSNVYVSFRTTQIYLSQISLINASNSNLTPTSLILVKPNTQSFTLGKVSQGDYTGINLALGLDSITNHGDPTQYAEGHPLAFQIPSMHWSWNQGYVFAVLEGKWSTNPINETNPGSNWYFHIGLDGNYQTRAPISINKTIKSCESNTIKLKIDLSQLFNGVDITVDNESLSTNNFGLSYRVGSNLINAISSNE